MITAIIWSKDRPCQLHLLLESIRTNLSHVFETKIIYKASTPEFQAGYNQVVNSFVNDSLFHESEKYDMERLTRERLEEANERVALFTDDTVIYRKSPLTGAAFIQKVMTDQSIFSLRLGFNTIVQNCHTGELQYPLNQFVDEGETIAWNFSKYHPSLNYGYPFGLDGHIFDRDSLKFLINEFRFKNTNELESHLCARAHRIAQSMRSFKESVAVNIPINGLSGVTRNGEKHPISLTELNQKYLAGEIIDLSKLVLADVVGCHQEIPFEFISKQSPKSPTNLKTELIIN